MCCGVLCDHHTQKDLSMLRRFLALTALLFAFASWAGAQGFTANMNYVPDSVNTALTTTCNGSTAIPDGQIVKIFWDSDSDGPDDQDPQPTICAVPPNCLSGPARTVNYNRFFMNGEAVGRGPGYFQTASAFKSALQLPVPARYYLRIYDPADSTQILWTSAVKTLVSGPQTVSFIRGDWSCGTGQPQCVVRDEHE
jgi:hypothetical protein